MSTNKPEFDWARLATPTRVVPRASVVRLKQRRSRAVVAPPQAYLSPRIDGHEDSYFEWLGAGIYCPEPATAPERSGQVLQELHYGFDEEFLYVRADPRVERLSALRDSEFRVSLSARDEARLLVAIEGGRFAGSLFDTEETCILGPHQLVRAAFDSILEIAIGRRLVRLNGEPTLALKITVWSGDRQLDSLPPEGQIELKLGADAFAWPIDEAVGGTGREDAEEASREEEWKK